MGYVSMKENRSVKNAIISYLKQAQEGERDSIAICEYLGLRVDRTYIALKELEDSGEVVRYNLALDGWNRLHYYEVA